MSENFDFINCAAYSFAMEQGASFDRAVEFKEDDDSPTKLRGYSAKMTIKQDPDADLALMELSTPNDGLSIDEGTISISASPEETAEMPVGKFFYDLTIMSENSVERMLEGQFEVIPRISR